MRIIDNKYMGIHDKIKAILATYCDEMGYDVSIEYRGQDWRADVMVSVNDTKYAFEIQNSPQTLKKTLERQSKYEKSGRVPKRIRNLKIFLFSTSLLMTEMSGCL